MKYEEELKYLLSLEFDEVPLVESKEAKEITWKELSKFIESEEKRPGRKMAFLYIAIIATIITIGAFYTFHSTLKEGDGIENNDVVWLSASTQFGEKKNVILSDGSEIWLHNGSRIIYPSIFGNGDRQIFAEGEVFAIIAKDPEHPFVMSTDKASVIVKGTKFNFKENRRTGNLEITLVEGNVDLLIGDEDESNRFAIEKGTILQANRGDMSVTFRKFDPESYVQWTERNVIYFNDETFESIVEDLESRFEIDIEVHRSSLLKMRFFASFVNDETPIQILNTLAKDNNVKIVTKANTIHIY